MSTDAPPLCSVCSSIGLQRTDFERPPFEPEGRYKSVVLTGTWGYLRRSRDLCPLCRLIAYALHKNEESSLDDEEDETEWEMTWSQSNDEYDPDSDEAENFYGSGLYPRLRKDGSHTDHCIQLVDEPSTDGFLRGRLIPDSMDAEATRGWLQRCAEKHGKDCKPTYLQIAPHPAASTEFMVIDVTMECLVNLPSDESYVALSYVWGQTNHLTTVKSLVSELRKPGAFKRRKPPRTIRDAIHLTRALEFHYLWVDSLCIVQDDDQTKGPLISNMDAVYGRATLTIVAASGLDAQAGLLGWRSSPLERPLVIESMGPCWRLGVLPMFDRAIMRSPHAKRGWTYQEGCLSARCLVILEGKAFFSCRAAVWREDVMAEVDDVAPLEGANTLGRTSSPWPLRRYMQHVGAYTMRQLTYQSDALNAFAGMGKALAASMASTRMFYAMPAAVFDWAILWMGSLSLRNLKRRFGFPSWTWVGWEGEIMMAGDTYSSLDQQWLLERTWIEWCLVMENSETVVIWEPERDQSTISPLITGSSDQTSEDPSGASVEVEGQRERSIHDRVTDGEGTGDEEEEEEEEEEEDDSEIDESDDGNDDEACPTYGNPSSGNPYGRQVKPQLVSALPARRVPKPSGLLHHRSLSPGTLVFSTVVASFAMDATSSFPSRGTGFFRLRDAADRVCGFIWDDLEHRGAARTNPHVREILLLSQASPGTSYMINGDKVGFADEYRRYTTREEALEASPLGLEPDGDYLLNEWHSWDFFNIMLPLRVKEEESSGSDKLCVYEREGIGFLHRMALAHAFGPEPQWRTVLLR